MRINSKIYICILYPNRGVDVFFLNFDQKWNKTKYPKCNKWNKVFKYVRELHRHINRKTLCEPIIGNQIAIK